MASMAQAGLPIAGITGILNSASGGRLRPARAEEGIGLVWEADAPFPAALPFELGLPTPLGLPTASPAPLPWQLPPAWDAFTWSSVEWAAEVTTAPERHNAPDNIRVAPGLLPDAPNWLPPETWGTGPAPVPLLPTGPDPAEPDSPLSEPGPVPPRPPGLPEPLFPPPVLEGGAAREVSVPEGLEDAIHQPSVTDRPAEGLGWRITGGADAELLLMDPAAGTLRFLTTPDAAQPADADGDNRYEVIFEVRDGWGAASTQQLTITVEDAVWG